MNAPYRTQIGPSTLYRVSPIVRNIFMTALSWPSPFSALPIFWPILSDPLVSQAALRFLMLSFVAVPFALSRGNVFSDCDGFNNAACISPVNRRINSSTCSLIQWDYQLYVRGSSRGSASSTFKNSKFRSRFSSDFAVTYIGILHYW